MQDDSLVDIKSETCCRLLNNTDVIMIKPVLGVKSPLGNNFRSLAQECNGFKGHVLSYDPGERTGWAWFHNFRLIDSGEVPTGNVGLSWNSTLWVLKRVLEKTGKCKDVPEQDQLHIAIEDYRVYSWKTDDHSWSQVHTIKVVGIIELLALREQLPYRLRMAEHAKTFCSDQRLRDWGFWQRGERHARDAIRHGCLYIVDYKRPKTEHARPFGDGNI